jgi:hypothetical protein
MPLPGPLRIQKKKTGFNLVFTGKKVSIGKKYVNKVYATFNYASNEAK